MCDQVYEKRQNYHSAHRNLEKAYEERSPKAFEKMLKKGFKTSTVKDAKHHEFDGCLKLSQAKGIKKKMMLGGKFLQNPGCLSRWRATLHNVAIESVEDTVFTASKR